MKTFAKILATLLVGSFLATATVSQADTKMVTKTKTVTKVMGKKKGYVHAHTFVKKNGTVVHVKGHYRKHGKMMGGKMMGSKMMKKTVTTTKTMKMAPKKSM